MASRYKTISTKRVLSCSPFDDPSITTAITGNTDLCPECFRKLKLKLDFKSIRPKSPEEKHHDKHSNCYDPKFTKEFNFIGIYIQPYDNSIWPNDCDICGEYRCHAILPDKYLIEYRKKLKHKIIDYRFYIALVNRIGKSEADKVALVINNL